MSLSKEYVSESDSDEEVVYQPPKGYHKIKDFKSLPKNLEKKEIWLIKTPKGFNFDKLQKLPVSFNPLEKSSSFQKDSKNYNVQEDLTNFSSATNSNQSKYSLLIPNAKKGLKIQNELKINRFYNISETVSIPNIDYGKVIKKRKNIRTIKGLKPQHFATGYDRSEGDVASDAEDEEDVDENVDQDGDVNVEDVQVKEEPKSEKKEKKEKKDKKEKKEKKDKKEKKVKKEKK